MSCKVVHGGEGESTIATVTAVAAASGQVFSRVHFVDGSLLFVLELLTEKGTRFRRVFYLSGDADSIGEHFGSAKSPARTTSTLITDLTNYSTVWPLGSWVELSWNVGNWFWESFRNLAIWIVSLVAISTAKFGDIFNFVVFVEVVPGDPGRLGVVVHVVDDIIELGGGQGRRCWKSINCKNWLGSLLTNNWKELHIFQSEKLN